jgi:YcxB-like protein
MAEKTEFGDGMRYWKTIKAIDQDTHNLYFIVDTMDARAMMAVVIPIRAFAAPQDAALFLDQARQYWMRERDRQPATIPALSSEHGRGTPPNHES